MEASEKAFQKCKAQNDLLKIVNAALRNSWNKAKRELGRIALGVDTQADILQENEHVFQEASTFIESCGRQVSRTANCEDAMKRKFYTK